MEWVKTTAKTLPEAIDLALDNLGVDESEAEIKVVEEPRQGLFGRMRGTAKVEARLKPKAARPKTERNRNRKGQKGGDNRNRGGGERNRNRNKNRSGGQGGGNNRSGGNRQNDRKQNDEQRGEGQSGKSQSGKGQSGKSQGGKGQNGDNRAKSGGQRDGRSGGGRGGNSSGGDRTANAAAAGRNSGGGRKGSSGQGGRSGSSNRRSNNNANTAKPKEESSVDEVADHLETFLSGLTEAFGFDSAVVVDRSEEDGLLGRIEGQHGLLVGPKGRTLDAVQELARISCQRTVPSSIRIKVDVGGYRQQRQEALGAFALKAADSAVETDAEVALEPMSAADRKAIHDALSEDGRVETRSVGTEPRRKVLVVPLEQSADDAEDTTDSAEEVASDNGSEEPTEAE